MFFGFICSSVVIAADHIQRKLVPREKLCNSCVSKDIFSFSPPTLTRLRK